ncbi:hypothetical protein [Anaeromyxobacter paludicola]|uniref:Uncharacterized protein n=1 Tax=Anaeromyxobacter paludicola TaxID=2918171 RepID=A0ABM7X7R3_9BACT|nr:hypothetical protein [Anaeromyxobacter paludicola]BDG07884.1 hypothetical protein AMPC_09970 [Anaeromyxobacter paludicola]
MVDHLVRITAALDGSPGRAARVEGLAAALGSAGFRLRRERRRLVAESADLGAADAKDLLRARGYADGEYQVFLEFVRQWGVM